MVLVPQGNTRAAAKAQPRWLKCPDRKDFGSTYQQSFWVTPNEQGDFIRQLREALETEDDEAVKDDARELLLALRRRPDITYRNVTAVDQLLADLSASKARESD